MKDNTPKGKLPLDIHQKVMAECVKDAKAMFEETLNRLSDTISRVRDNWLITRCLPHLPQKAFELYEQRRYDELGKMMRDNGFCRVTPWGVSDTTEYLMRNDVVISKWTIQFNAEKYCYECSVVDNPVAICNK